MARPVELIQLAGPIVGAVAAVLAATRKRLVTRLRKAGATDEASAISLEGGGPFRRWWTSRLLRDGVLGASADGRHWLNEQTWKEYQGRRRRWALTIVTLLLLGLALFLAGRALGEP